MPLSLYDISVPRFINGLQSLQLILSKGSAYAEEQKIPPAQLIEARLIDDMFALPFQIQQVTDYAKNGSARVAGIDIVPFPDKETTFEELQARVQKAIDILKTVPEDSMDGKEEKEIVLKLGSEYKFSAKNYLLNFALPNFYFHLTTAYNILRAKGVPLGKRDFIGDLK